MLRVPERHPKRLTLELGVKVFTKLDDASIRRTCREALDGWRKLIEDARRVCVLLWIGDGDNTDIYREIPPERTADLAANLAKGIEFFLRGS